MVRNITIFFVFWLSWTNYFSLFPGVFNLSYISSTCSQMLKIEHITFSSIHFLFLISDNDVKIMVLMSLWWQNFLCLFLRLVLILSDSYLRNELCSCDGAEPLATTRGANEWSLTMVFTSNNGAASSNSVLDFVNLMRPLRSVSLFYRPYSNNYLHVPPSRSLIDSSLLW